VKDLAFIEETGEKNFEIWGSSFTKKPLVASIVLEDFDLKTFFENLKDKGKMLFESSKVDEKNRFSFIGTHPEDFFHVKGDTVFTKYKERVSSSHLNELKKEISSRTSPVLESLEIPLTGGALGFFSYEASRFFSPIKFPSLLRDESSFFDYAFWFYDELFVFNHTTKSLYLCASHEFYEEAKVKLKSLKKDFSSAFFISNQVKEEKKISSHLNGSNFDYKSYLEAIEKCRDYIESGHSYQINLSQEISCESTDSPWNIYKKLISINPVSYGAYFSIGDFHVICGSPELLVRKCGKKLLTRPIAGTRRRGTIEENSLFEKELKEDKKERAEHAMLVDLMRNDLGKISKKGTVKIDTYAEVVHYTHVMHLESDLSSEVEEETHPIDIFGALFPGGTVTGVPKLRTMEIIEELEPTERNIYTGSVGYISYTGDLEFNIVIRSLLFKDNHVSFHVGGGLTYDCIGKQEYKETLNKGKSQLSALGVHSHEMLR
jgi:para-aminobenzoate synthetase component 1